MSSLTHSYQNGRCHKIAHKHRNIILIITVYWFTGLHIDVELTKHMWTLKNHGNTFVSLKHPVERMLFVIEKKKYMVDYII